MIADGRLPHSSQSEKRPARKRAGSVRLDDDVARDAEARSEPCSEPVLGDVGDAGQDGLAWIAASQASAGNLDAPGADVPHPRDRLGQLALTVPRYTRDADDLALPDRERDIVDGRLAAITRNR